LVIAEAQDLQATAFQQVVTFLVVLAGIFAGVDFAIDFNN
jgi:preprotein translocase subunit SecE